MLQYSLESLDFRGLAVFVRSENAGITGSTPVLSTIYSGNQPLTVGAKPASVLK
jgi:hypothetical protein